jgi:hypothetical protein
VQWLGGNTANLKTNGRLVWLGLMLISGLLWGIVLLPGTSLIPRRTNVQNLVLRYLAAFAVAVIILKFVVVLSWIRLFAMDYLVSFLLCAGLTLWVGRWRKVRISDFEFRISQIKRLTSEIPIPKSEIRNRFCLFPFSHATLAAIYVIVVIGIIGGSYLFQFTLPEGRWWRFPVLTAAGFPLIYMDELFIRAIYPRWKSFALAVLSRVLLGAITSAAVLILNPTDAFIVLIIHLVVLFWILLWAATELVHRHTQDAAASALFAALIQGWVFAALFVTT